MVHPVIRLLLEIIQIYDYILITWVILSALISLGIVNRHQPIVQRINFALFRLTNPLLRHIRKYMPDLGGFDISPVIAILGLEFLSNMLVYYSV